MNKNQEVANRLNGWKLSKRATRIIGATEIDLMDEIFGKLETPEDVEEMISQNYIHGIKNEKTYILRNLRAMGQTEECSGADLHEDNVYTGKELTEWLKDLTEEDGETLTLDAIGELDPEGLYYWVDEYIFEIEKKQEEKNIVKTRQVIRYAGGMADLYDVLQINEKSCSVWIGEMTWEELRDDQRERLQASDNSYETIEEILEEKDLGEFSTFEDVTAAVDNLVYDENIDRKFKRFIEEYSL